ncbi:MAG: ThuA domain-containing protein [Gemmataceae bacterium]
MLSTLLAVMLAADPLPAFPVEQSPADANLAKVVLVAGSNYYKAGEHSYVAGCMVLADLLRQTPGVAPVLALDWPKKPETLAGAKAVVLMFDGGDKHGLLTGDRFAQFQKLADGGTGVVLLHQCLDCPTEFGDRLRALGGAAWEKGYSQRAHWVAEFKEFPNHPVMRGVKPFQIDDGWLTKLRFSSGMKGITPLVRTSNPKGPTPGSPEESVVGWAFERPKGRSFAFTGCHLHASFAEEGYRRFLVNGILWSAGLAVPPDGSPVALDLAKLPQYLVTSPAPQPPSKK